MTREELRQAILSESGGFTIEPVPTPEWPKVNGQIFVRTLTLPERTRYLAEIRSTILQPEVQADGNGKAAKQATDTAGVKLAVISMCDSEGLTFMEESDITALAKQGWAALNRVVDVSARLNGMTKQSMELAKNVLPSAVMSSSSTVSH